VTIDFIELEKAPAQVTFNSISGDKVQYNGNGSDLRGFIIANTGKTIYLPAKKYSIPEILVMPANTTLQGAGMWYTQLDFTADPNNISTCSNRGIDNSQNNVTIDGLYLTTINNVRYYEHDRNQTKSMGKALMGSWGKDSKVTNVWVQHFECGGWINGANGLYIAHCRFRDNYADGINLTMNSQNCIVEHCSFRNNGDDQMASWSRSSSGTVNNTFRYCTAENGWRAGGISFYGGTQNRAHHCVVIDQMENGLRADSHFSGTGFGQGFIEFSDISVYKGGTSKNAYGHFASGAIVLSTSDGSYNVKDISFKNIDLIDSKLDAININATEPRYIIDACFENINVNGTNVTGEGSGYAFKIESNVKGTVVYKNLTTTNVSGRPILNSASANNFTLTNSGDDDPCNIINSIEDLEIDGITVSSSDNNLTIQGAPVDKMISIYTLSGSMVGQKLVTQDVETFSHLKAGVYVVSIEGRQSRKVVVNN
jgi:hypothetical protein